MHAAQHRILREQILDPDIEYARRLGAHEVIDVTSADSDRVGPVDAVVDLVGGEAQERSLSQLAPGGVLVSAVSQPDQERASQCGVKAMFMLVQVATAPLARIASLLDDGQLMMTRVGTVLPLTDARVAHEMLEGMRSRPRGKIVLQVRSGPLCRVAGCYLAFRPGK